jgi:hypothetical protein
MLRKGGMEESLGPPVVLHAVREAAPDDGDPVALFQRDGGTGRNQRGGAEENSEDGAKNRGKWYHESAILRKALRGNSAILTNFRRFF